MKQRITLFFILTLLLSSCALNKLFLVPFELTTDTTFTTYVKEYNDSLTLTFTDEKEPIIKGSNDQLIDFPYTLENVFFPNSNGDTLNAWFFTPDSNYNGITIYFLHGNAGNLIYNNQFVPPFVRAGFQVLTIDYSGFGFSEGKATRKNVLKDANDGLKYLMSRKDIKYDKLVIYGQSLGGHLAVVVAEKNQDKIDGLIIEGAFSSHKDIASEKVPLLGRIFTREMYSAEKSIPKITKPVLIIHSTEDTTIPYSHGERLYELATEPKSLYTIDQRHIRGPLFYADSIVAKIKQMVK